MGGSKRVFLVISFTGDCVFVPAPLKLELPFKFKPSSIVPKISSGPSASFIFTNGSAVSVTKSAPLAIPPPVLSEALFIDASSIAVSPEIVRLSVVAVLP